MMYQGKYASGHAAPPAKTPKAKPRRSRAGTIVFYCFYVLFIAAFCVGLAYALRSLDAWLVRYEASQPDVKCEEVFSQLFAQPDWKALYHTAGIQDTEFEGADSFAAYMEAKVGGQTLTCSETSAGLSGDHKYIVRLGKEKLAVFTLTGGSKSETEIPEWKLGSLEFFYTAGESVSVLTLPGRTVYLNGVPLPESATVSRTETAAEKYLPEGLHGLRYQVQYADGFLVAPTVTAEDGEGNAVELVYDGESGMYREAMPTFTYDENEEKQIRGAAEVYCKYMIRAVGWGQLKYYFDKDSEIHESIRKNDTWMQSYAEYRLEEAEISDFYRYSEDLFSARVTTKMFVTRWDYTVKEYDLDTTFFFTRIGDTFYATDMTNVDVQQQITQVRLNYYQDGTLLDSQMVDSETAILTPPAVTAPEGKEFAGWLWNPRTAAATRPTPSCSSRMKTAMSAFPRTPC